MYTISLDIGGTFTDGFFTRGAKCAFSKVPTTPHDLTICLLDCLEAGARELGTSLKDLLARTAVARLSSTLATNILVQGTGARVGLLVTRGYEQSLYSTAVLSPAVGVVVRPEMIAGLDEAVSPSGDVEVPVSPGPVLEAVRYLISQGARIIAVGLHHASANPVNERQVREHIYGRYPEHYLRSVPVQLSTEVSDVPDDYARTNSLLLNAYFHLALASVLYKLEDRVREAGLRHPLLVVHSTGGVARVSKTTALHTLASGPAAGLMGASTACRDYYPSLHAVAMDIGGTSTDFGLIADGACPFALYSEVGGLRCSMPAVQVHSIGLGGGSIASVSSNVEVQVGPRSAGAYPGPAAFARGGTQPTLTDANLVLGFVDPSFFLGGKQPLHRDRAEAAIEAHLARALHCSVVEAAAGVRATADSVAAQALAGLLHGSQDAMLLAYGGGGPLHCCAIAERAGLHTVVTFPIASVFSAYGVSTMDVMHVYMVSRRSTLYGAQGGGYMEDAGPLDSAVARMRERALVDMRGEGFSEADIRFELELVLESPRREGSVRLSLPEHGLGGAAAVREICRRFQDQANDPLAMVRKRETILTKTLVLRASVAMPRWSFPVLDDQGPDSQHAILGHRDVYWPSLARWQSTPVFHMAKLRCGNRLEGPAIVEAADTTCALPPGWTLRVDQHLDLVMGRT